LFSGTSGARIFGSGGAPSFREIFFTATLRAAGRLTVLEGAIFAAAGFCDAVFVAAVLAVVVLAGAVLAAVVLPVTAVLTPDIAVGFFVVTVALAALTVARGLAALVLAVADLAGVD